MSTKVLLDNSAFAGVMRLYSPDIEMHRMFLHNYPNHQLIDEHSLSDFLMALCIYEEIFLDSSSHWNEKELKREGYDESEYLDDSNASWAEQLKRLLPKDVSTIIKTDYFGGGSAIDEDESCSKAYDIMSSPLKSQILLDSDEKIPNVYFAHDYVYRPVFDRLNMNNGFILTENELAQAMFLHRGLFLQSRAHRFECVYMPYHYRGKILSKLPPMVWVKAPDDGFAHARLPLARGNRPSETDYIKCLNEYYFTLIQAVTWTTYPSDVPFIGTAILSAAKGNPDVAIEMAMNYRQKGVLKQIFKELDAAARSQDRPYFESIIKQCRSELAQAAAHFGVEGDTLKQRLFYKLATCWLPKNLQEVVDAAVQLLPENVKHWGYQISSSLITKTPLQMLFLEHIGAIRNI
jgi:hypothetical protein